MNDRQAEIFKVGIVSSSIDDLDLIFNAPSAARAIGSAVSSTARFRAEESYLHRRILGCLSSNCARCVLITVRFSSATGREGVASHPRLVDVCAAGLGVDLSLTVLKQPDKV
jgi:hypothetical protein